MSVYIANGEYYCEECANDRIIKAIKDYALLLVVSMPLIESRYINQQTSDMKFISGAFEL
jgi:hypothetical protein